MLDLDSMLCPFCGGEMDERGGQCNCNKKTMMIDLKCKQCETVIKFKTKWQENPYREAIEAFNRRAGMDELISKEKLRQEALRIGGHFYSDWDTGGVLSLIARQPKVEAKAIEYAHWVYDTNGLDWGLGAWVCSSCHTKNDNIPAMQPDINPLWFAGSKFCPNCGKTMIKAEDDK